MKNLILLFILLSFFNSLGQELKEFKQTSEYQLTGIDSITTKKYWENYPMQSEPKLISNYLKNKRGKKLFEIKVGELEFYSGTTVEVLEIDNLKNIEQIIHLKSSYDACCSSYSSTYLLKTKNGKLMELPETE